MTEQTQNHTLSTIGMFSFAELVAKRPAIFGEDPGGYQMFHASLLRNFAPQDSYELVLADELVQLCWQINQTRHLETTHMRRNIREQIYTAVTENLTDTYDAQWDAEWDAHIEAGRSEHTFNPSTKRTPDEWAERAEDLAARATSLDTDRANQAHLELSAMGIDASTITYAAFFEPGTTHRLDRLEERQHTLERRRRELQRDYERLQERRPIEANAVEL